MHLPTPEDKFSHKTVKSLHEVALHRAGGSRVRAGGTVSLRGGILSSRRRCLSRCGASGVVHALAVVVCLMAAVRPLEAQNPEPPAGPWAILSGAEATASVPLPVGNAVPTSQFFDFQMTSDTVKLVLTQQPPPSPSARMQFLFRIVSNNSDLQARLSIWFADKNEAAVALTKGNWRVGALETALGWPKLAWRLEVAGKPGGHIQVVLPASPSADWQPDAALRDLSGYLSSNGSSAEARMALEGFAELTKGTGQGAVAARDAAGMAMASGDMEGAAGLYLRSLIELGNGPAVWATFPGVAGYSQDRLSLDFADGSRDRLNQVGKLYPALLTDPRYQDVAVDYPLRPASRTAALGIGNALVEAGKRDEALLWLLLVLDAGGDHDPTKATLRLAENQRFLGEIAKPIDAAMLGDCLKLLASIEGVSPDDGTTARIVKGWNAGEEAGLKRHRGACEEAFREVARLCKNALVKDCAFVVLSQWLHHMGYFIEAEQALPKVKDITSPSLAQWVAFQRGRVLVSEGLYQAAHEQFGQAVKGPYGLLADHSRLYLGECLEFQGNWTEAVAAYGDAVRISTNPEVKRKAEFWKYRVSTLAKDYQPASDAGVQYWGEDRQTQGQWDGYGEDAFLLCSTGGPWDLMGGRAAPFQYEVYTTDPKRHRYFWNYTSVVPHPSLLNNPVWHEPMAANWDDGGEKYAVGTGPDLLVDLPVPKGEYRLSLYLTNDFNYYEPNRSYTIYLLNQEKKVLAACPVRDFEGGVYYHFLVTGPQNVTVRIFRNLSMNILLQGMFLDRLDTRKGAMMRPSNSYGPLETLVREKLKPSDRETHISIGGPDARRATLAKLVAASPPGLPQLWQQYRLINAYGGGRSYEERCLDQIYKSASEHMKAEDAYSFWSDVATAQGAAGLRSGVLRFTRLALGLIDDPAVSRERQLEALEEALERVHSEYAAYYDAYPGRTQNGTYPGPVDEPYSLQLAQEYIKRASEGQTLMRAAADILPLARKYCRDDRVLGQRLFEAVGAQNLGIADLELYGGCTDDKPAAVKALRTVVAAMPEGDKYGWWKRKELVRALCEAGDWAGANAEMEKLVADSSVSDSTKAGTVYNTAFMMMGRQQKEAARKWFEVVAGQFGGTQYGQLAKSVLAKGLKMPWEERKP